MRKEGGRDEWEASRRSVCPEMGQGGCDGAVIICVCHATGRSS